MLTNQRNNYQASLGSLQNELNILEEKKVRLEAAKKSLDVIIQSTIEIKQKFANINVDKSQWYGVAEKEHENKFNVKAIDELSKFVNSLQTSSDDIASAISSANVSIGNTQSDLAYTKNQISATDNQIANEKRKESSK